MNRIRTMCHRTIQAIPTPGKRPRLLQEEQGQALVVFAAFMGVVAIGFLGFAIDVGSLFREKRMAQAAADGAAIAAAEEVSAGATSNEQSAANAIAKLNGFDTGASTNPATVTLSTPATGNFTGTTYVQAIVSMPVNTSFIGAFASSMKTMTVSAKSIAGGSKTSQTCVCLGGTTGQTLHVSNGASLVASGCGIVDNSTSSNSVVVTGAGSLTALSLGLASSSWTSASNVTNGGTLTSSTTVTGVTSQCAPTMPAAPTYSSCLNDPGGSYGTHTFGPATASGTICYKSLTVGANGSTDTLNPGTYVITTGDIHFLSGANGHSNLGGNGVFIYLTGTSSLQISNGANVNLVAGGATLSGGGTAPSLGAYDGIVVYQATGDATAITLQGGSSTYINGALYAPSAPLTISNGSGATSTGAIDAASLTVNGGSTVTATANVNEGSLSIGTAKLVQ